MQKLEITKNKIHFSFCIDDEKRLILLYIGTNINRFKEKKAEPDPVFVPCEIFASGENPDSHHGAKHIGSLLSQSLRYVSHSETDNGIVFNLASEKLSVKLHYDFYENLSAFTSYTEVENIGKESIGLEYVSSLCLYNFDIDKVHLCHNSWWRELNWRSYKPEELGFSKINNGSTKRIFAQNTGTWSTKEYMPMAAVENSDGTMLWQIEHNGSWSFEMADTCWVNYLRLSGPSEQENSWWKDLKPGQSFSSVKASIVFAEDLNDAFAQMTKLRRKTAYRSPKDISLPVIFNDYMGCLNADPTTEKELPVIDAAAKAGAEIYCMDAGWYADGIWWETVGEWEVCEKRFKNGMKEVFDYIIKKGMIPGIWLEPEVMGIDCPALKYFDDSCFFVRHGKRVIDHGRYHFDFRNKKVTEYLNNVVDRLISEYNIQYFKFDYNIDGGVGTEIDSDSFGDGLMKHQKAYLDWVDGLYERHPGLIIENCASGGMRMDSESLRHFSLQSLSDAASYELTAVIAAMSSTAVIPEQAQVWVLPMKEHTDSEIAFSMVSAMFRRPVLSAEIPFLSEEQFEIVKHGVEFYKSVRNEIPGLIPFWPLGAVNFENDIIVNGYKGENHSYICVGRLAGNGEIKIPISENSAEVVYPTESSCKCSVSDNVLTVSLNEKSAAVIKVY